MIEEAHTLRVRVLLSVQRALWGEISSQLRAVVCSWEDSRVAVDCYFDGEISGDDLESVTRVEAEVTADFPEYTVVARAVRLDFPNALRFPPSMHLVYLRKETIQPKFE